MATKKPEIKVGGWYINKGSEKTVRHVTKIIDAGHGRDAQVQYDPFVLRHHRYWERDKWWDGTPRKNATLSIKSFRAWVGREIEPIAEGENKE